MDCVRNFSKSGFVFFRPHSGPLSRYLVITLPTRNLGIGEHHLLAGEGGGDTGDCNLNGRRSIKSQEKSWMSER